MPYAYVKLSQALVDLSQRLYDSGAQQFWNDAEKTVYLQEALRTWNAHTSFYRDEFLMSTTPNTIWHDITDPAVVPNTLRKFNRTDVDLYNTMEYHLLEPPTGATWTGSLQFGITDLLQAVQRRRDEVLSISGCTTTRRLITAGPGRILLPDVVIDIRRIAWLPAMGYSITPLWPDDVWALQSFETNFQALPPGVPSTYRRSTEPPLSFNVDVSPIVPGSYEVLSVDSGAALGVVNPTLLQVPDDFAWVIKWGALADLLSRESVSDDPIRAQYCIQRFSQGLALLKEAPAIVQAVLDNTQLSAESAQNMDNYDPGWQARTAAMPNTLVISGLNLIGFSPPPDAGPYSVALTVVANIPVPVVANDFLQVSKDDYDAILAYAQHLAAFKMGGQEFLGSIPLLQHFIEQASKYNSRLSEMGEFQKDIYEVSQLQEETNPRFAPEAGG